MAQKLEASRTLQPVYANNGLFPKSLIFFPETPLRASLADFPIIFIIIYLTRKSFSVINTKP